MLGCGARKSGAEPTKRGTTRKETSSDYAICAVWMHVCCVCACVCLLFLCFFFFVIFSGRMLKASEYSRKRERTLYAQSIAYKEVLPISLTLFGWSMHSLKLEMCVINEQNGIAINANQSLRAKRAYCIVLYAISFAHQSRQHVSWAGGCAKRLMHSRWLS